MIKGVSHFSVFVLDQDEAIKFYTEVLGCHLKADTQRGQFRWTTVAFPGEPEVEIILVPAKEGALFNQETATLLTQLIQSGTFGMAVLHTPNIDLTYIELKEKGVNFLQEPKEISFGKEALFEDNSGNWFSLLEPNDNGYFNQ